MGTRQQGKPRTLPASVDAYLARLPSGWQSYPECRAEASLLGTLRASGSLDGLATLPDELAPHIAPGTTGWIPEVVHVGVLLTIRDERFSDPNGEEAFLAWLNRLNGDLLPDRSHIGPEVAVREFPTIWSSLHLGTYLEVLEVRPRGALIVADHAEPLFPPLARRWRRDAVVGYLARAGAVQPRAVELGRVDGKTQIAVTWK